MTYPPIVQSAKASILAVIAATGRATLLLPTPSDSSSCSSTATAWPGSPLSSTVSSPLSRASGLGLRGAEVLYDIKRHAVGDVRAVDIGRG